MPNPGWYVDPGGRPGHYRFWDGQSWGLSTTPDPPGLPSGGPPPPPRRRRAAPWVIAGTVLLVVLAVVGALVVRNANRPIVDHGPSPTATGGEGTTPTPSVVPSPSTSPSPSETASAFPCPIGNPRARQDYPRDGRVHGGSLSFPSQPGWSEPGHQINDFTWAYDVGETDVPVEAQWYASYAVGAVAVADGFEDPRSAAELAMRCTAPSTLYHDVTSRTDLVNKATTVDGYRAWTLRSEIRVADERTTLPGDTVQITVVDLDSPDALAFFWGCAPIGDDVLTAQLDEVAKELRVG